MRLLAIINPVAGREAFQKNIRDMLEHLSTQSRYSKIDIRVTNRQITLLIWPNTAAVS